MNNKRVIKFLICAVSLSLILGACSSSNSNDASKSNSTVKRKSVSGSNSKLTFVAKVAAACKAVDQSVFDDIANSDVQAIGSAAFNEAIQKGEDELDKVISKFDDIDPPSQYQDDWDTFLEDFSAIRDAFPDLATAVQNLSTMTTDLTSPDDAARQKAEEDLSKLQSDMEALTEDLSQRTQEISDIASRLGLDKACDINA